MGAAYALFTICIYMLGCVFILLFHGNGPEQGGSFGIVAAGVRTQEEEEQSEVMQLCSTAINSRSGRIDWLQRAER